MIARLDHKEGKKRRDSNIELLRIVAMLGVVACHYVVCTNIAEECNTHTLTAKSLYLATWGMWGATAVNVYVMITGYFLCCTTMTRTRYFRVLSPVLMYAFLSCAAHSFIDRDMAFVSACAAIPLRLLEGVNVGFVSSYLCFLLFVPFLNQLTGVLGCKNHLKLISLLVIIQSVLPLGVKGGHVWSPICWYVTVYLVGSWIRIYSDRCRFRTSVIALALFASIIAAVASVWGILLVESSGRITSGAIYSYPWLLVSKSHPLAFVIAVLVFVLFLNWRIRFSRIVNLIASSTFSVLLIQVYFPEIWRGVELSIDASRSSILILSCHSIASLFFVFFGCVVVDLCVKSICAMIRRFAGRSE